MLEDGGRVADPLLRGDLLLLWLLLELHVEEPFVYLDPAEAGLLHGLLADLAVPFTTQFLEEQLEVFNLRVCLLLTAHIVLKHGGRLADLLFTFTLPRDQDFGLDVGLVLIVIRLFFLVNISFLWST